MKIHKITLYVADSDIDDIESIIIEIENTLPDYHQWFGKCETKELGEWSDDHKWNFSNINPDEEWKKLEK